ncbi:MAG: hypothetical protein K2J26_04970 [Ruminococcus sp.]|nr:hypothetical protein [Ruminococcus sp.]
MRKRLLDGGAEAFHDHEILEMLLFYCIPRKNTNEIAHALIESFGSINGVLNADIKELQKIDGIGAVSAKFIKFMSDVCRSYSASAGTLNPYLLFDDRASYLRKYFQNTPDGICLMVCPDNGSSIVFNSLSFTDEDYVKIINTMISREWSRVIVGINCGREYAVPERNEDIVYNRIKNQLTPLGIELIDFILVGRDSVFSLLLN